MSHSEHMVWQCAAEVKTRYADEAEKTVQRQIAWSRERGAENECAFWDAVLERLAQSRAKLEEDA